MKFDKQLAYERFAGCCNGAGGVLLALTLNHTIDCPIWAPLIVVFFPVVISLLKSIKDLVVSRG